MADLLCCPFCGSDAFVLSRENRHWACCKNDECGAETQGKTTHSDAVTAWNTCSTLSDAVAEREAEPVAHVRVKDGYIGICFPNDPDAFPVFRTPPTSELDALRKRVAEIDAHRRKVLAENVRLLNALIERDRRVAELEKAVDGLLAPFEHDECRKDHHGYCQAHFLEEECCVATARRVREGGK